MLQRMHYPYDKCQQYGNVSVKWWVFTKFIFHVGILCYASPNSTKQRNREENRSPQKIRNKETKLHILIWCLFNIKRIHLLIHNKSPTRYPTHTKKHEEKKTWMITLSSSSSSIPIKKKKIST